VQNAAANGVTSFVSVVDRNSGAVLAQTGNAGAQVASESIMKLFLAAYYLRLYSGQSATPQAVKDRLAYMLIYSDNDIASSIFTAGAIPTVANAYGLGSTINATDRVGHWGAARITAADMTTFLFRAAHDDQVGPWLIPVMAQTAPTGSGADAGFSQYFGMNALGGEHGSKQGWGCDSFWTNPQCAVHSVGYTDRYFVAVLQLGNGYPDPMRDTSTATARTVQASTTALVDGDFICDSDSGAVYRMAGGAPVYVSTWSAFGGPQACRVMSGAEISRLPMYPADGTFLRGTSTGAVYRIGGGAPVYVSTWAAFGGVQPATNVDEAAIDLAGSGWYSHLLYRPADGTFVRGSTTGAVYRMAGGAPVYVSTWAAFGGVQPATTIDEAAIDLIGSSDYYDHIAAKPVDGTFLRGTSTGAVYRIVGGAPVYVSTWAAFGGLQPATNVDEAAIDLAGSGWYSHLLYRPADGTFLRGTSTGAVYRIAGGAPVYVPTWAAFGGLQPATNVDEAAIDLAGSGWYTHLSFYPADGTFLQGLPGGQIYRIASGVAVSINSWDPYGGVQPFTAIPQQTVDLAGTGGFYRHLID
jgi:hypothetical protein